MRSQLGLENINCFRRLHSAHCFYSSNQVTEKGGRTRFLKRTHVLPYFKNLTIIFHKLYFPHPLSPSLKPHVLSHPTSQPSSFCLQLYSALQVRELSRKKKFAGLYAREARKNTLYFPKLIKRNCGLPIHFPQPIHPRMYALRYV